MSAVQKLSVALTDDQVDALRAAVESGEYATTSEIVQEAVCDWQQRRALRLGDSEHLRRLWDDGKASGEPRLFDLERTLASAKARAASGDA